MRATSLFALCCLVLILGAHALDMSVVAEAHTAAGLEQQLITEAVQAAAAEAEQAIAADLAMDVALEQELTAEAQAEAEVEADLEMLASGQLSSQGFFKKVGAAIKKVGAAIKKDVKKAGDKIKAGAKKAGAKLKAAGKKVGTAIKKAGEKIKAAVAKLFDPSIKIGPPILSVKNFDEVVARDLMLLSGMAYCPASNLKAWNCKSCSRFKMFGHWVGNNGKSTQVVVVGDTATNSIYVAYRGTMGTLKQWLKNLDFGWKTWSGCSGCRVHGGFKTIFDEVKGVTMEYIKKAQAAMPTADIYLTGHSMGAAIATMMSMHLHQSQPHMAPTQLYTVGSPRVGNGAFRDKVNAVFGANYYRIKNQKDMIPDVPFRGQGFAHAGTLVLCADGSKTCFVGSNGQENPRVLGFVGELMQTLVGLFKISAHLKYMDQGLSKMQCTGNN